MTQGRANRAKSEAGASESRVWVLRLYVAGQTPRSLTALANLKAICERHLEGRSCIEVIDLLEDPERARADQVFALPTLVRKQPPPVRKILGDLSDIERVLAGLELGKPA